MKASNGVAPAAWEVLSAELGFVRKNGGVTSWGNCVSCGAAKASVGPSGYLCTTCGWSAPLESYAPWPDKPRLPGPDAPTALTTEGLPSSLATFVDQVHWSLQVPTELPLSLGLAVLSVAVGGKVVVEVGRGWEEPTVLYLAVILPPASRKSPTFRLLTSPLEEWEEERQRQAAPGILAARDRVEVVAKKLATLKSAVANGNATPDELEAARLELAAAEAAVPPEPRLLAGDITPEEMCRRLAAQGGRLGILEPEGGPLRSLERYSDDAKLEEVKKAWSMETIRVDRRGRDEPIFVRRPALTLGLALQPGVLESLKNKKAFRGEGVLGRVLFTAPPHGLGRRLTGRNVPELPAGCDRDYRRVVMTLLDSEPRTTDSEGRPVPFLLRLTEEARDVLAEYEAEVEADLADGARLAGIRDWAGKVAGQAVRLAAVLELAGRAERGRPVYEGPMSADSMRSGIALARGFTTHALKVFGDMDARGEDVLAHRVLARLREPERPETVADLWRSMRRTKAFDSVEDLREVVDELVRRGCVRLRPTRATTAGRPASEVIEVHPGLRGGKTYPLYPLNPPGNGARPSLVDLVDEKSVPEPGDGQASDPLAVMEHVAL